MFWRKKKQQVEQVVDDVAATATDLAEKTMTIGPSPHFSYCVLSFPIRCFG
jgi:hypothetical protein